MLSLTTYRSPANSLSNWIENFLSSELAEPRTRDAGHVWMPRVDIIEEKDSYRLHADIPGLSKEDIKIAVENGVLTISGERKAEKREKADGQYEYYERSYGSFTRSFNLPDHVDPAGVAASYRNGVLELVLRKREEAKPRAIEVKVE